MLLSGIPIAAQTILATDFSKADAKTYANGDVIGPANDPTAQLTANSGAYDGATSQWNPSTADNNQVKVEAVDGHKVLQLSEGTAISKSLSDSPVQGTIVFTILPTPAAGRTTAVIVLTKDAWFATGPANIFDFEISQSLALRYTGGMVSNVLTPGTKYRIDFTVDYSNAQQHTWGFTLYEGDGTDKMVFASGPSLTTRNPTAVPNTFSIHQYDNGAQAPSTDSLLSIERISLSASAPSAPAKDATPKP